MQEDDLLIILVRDLRPRIQRGKIMPKPKVVILHAHRELPDHPEKELDKLLWRIVQEVYDDNILAMAEDYSQAKAAEVYLQIVNKGRIDRDELFDSMIAWANEKLKAREAATG